MNHNMTVLLIATIMLLPACADSRYKVPVHRMPPAFTHQNTLSVAEPLSDWWKQAQDQMLDQLIDIAIVHNYDIAIAMESVQAARARYNLSAAQLLPLFTGAGQLAKLGLSKALLENTLFNQRNFNFLNCGFDASWELDIWGRKLHQKKAQYAAMQAEIEQLHGVYITLVAEVARTYVDLCAADQLLVVIKNQCGLERKKLQLIIVQYQAGLVPRTNVVEQQQAVEAIEIAYQDIVRARAESYHNLLFLLGSYEGRDSFSLSTGPVPLLDIEPTVGMPSSLLQRRPDIRAAERTFAADHELSGYAATEWFPQFSLIGSLYSESNLSCLWFTGQSLQWWIGPSVSWPIINFGRIRARIDEARANERAAALSYSKTVIAAFRDVEDSLVSYYTGKNQLQDSYLAYRAAKEQYEYAADLFATGLTSELEQIDACLNMLNRNRSLIGYEQLVATAIIALYKALGGGW